MKNSTTLLLIAKSSNNPISLEFLMIAILIAIGFVAHAYIQLKQIQNEEKRFMQQIRKKEEMKTKLKKM